MMNSVEPWVPFTWGSVQIAWLTCGAGVILGPRKTSLKASNCDKFRLCCASDSAIFRPVVSASCKKALSEHLIGHSIDFLYLLQYNLWNTFNWTVEDPGFPTRGTTTPEGVPTYYLANFSRKLLENEDILGERDPPMQWRWSSKSK